VRRAFVDPAAGQLADYRALLARVPLDLVVTDTMGLGAMLLQELGGPPWASIGVTVAMMRRPDAPPLKSGLAYARTPQARAAYDAFWVQLDDPLRAVTALFDSQRAAVGLPPLPDGVSVADVTISPNLHLQSGTAAFDYPYEQPPAHLYYVGPLLPPSPGPGAFIPPPWWSELAGRPVVHVTQGTVVFDPVSLVLPTIRALADDDALVVATVPDLSGLGKLPANVRVARYLPHPELLPLVDVMVTNGGFNGVITALAHGVPLVAGGEHADKADVCARIAWSGAGIDLGTENPSEASLAAAVRRVRDDPAYRRNAAGIRDDFATHNPAAEAADLLERLAATGGPVVPNRETALSPSGTPCRVRG
jgi:UDP:flavonoid glycosyltransferase YjiC (YdhE family)